MSWKSLLYLLTLGTAFFFGWQQIKMKAELTASFQESRNPGDYGVLNTIKERAAKGRIMDNQPAPIRRRYRTFMALKVLFLIIFVIELTIFQR